MKKIYFLFMILIIPGLSFAQKPNEVRASMGIDFVNVPSLKNYLEANFTDRLSSFSSAVNFSGSYGRMISKNDQLEAEIGYLLNSFNSALIGGTYDLTYSIVIPSAIYYYVISGTGYNFKFGGGAGPRFLSATEKLPADPNNYNYSSLGYGFILRAAGNTAIAENVFAHIAVDVRYDSIKEPQPSQDTNVIGNVNFNSLSFGIRLGISYQF
jgi:hypothetical protein